jgi:hypothetical protein
MNELMMSVISWLVTGSPGLLQHPELEGLIKAV